MDLSIPMRLAASEIGGVAILFRAEDDRQVTDDEMVATLGESVTMAVAHYDPLRVLGFQPPRKLARTLECSAVPFQRP